MREFPKGGLIGKTVGFFRAVARLRVSVYAANACYFLILSVFPSLLLLLSLLRNAGLEPENLTKLLSGVIPGALMATVEQLILSAYQSGSAALVSLSAVTALWSAGRGIYGLLTGLNSIYEVREDRGYFYTRAVSMGYTVLFLIMLLLTLMVYMFGSSVLRLLPADSVEQLEILSRVANLRFFVLLFLQTALFCAMFMVLPNQKNSFRESLPGALLSSAGWLLFSQGYSVYVRHFAGYTNIFGSVYAVALSMLWLYCCVSILFYGGALNSYLLRRARG